MSIFGISSVEDMEKMVEKIPQDIDETESEKYGIMEFEYKADKKGEISAKADEFVFVLDESGGWSKIKKKNGKEGFVPTSHVKIYLEGVVTDDYEKSEKDEGKEMTAKKGEKVIILEQCSDWTYCMKIKNNKTGFISRSYVKVV